MEDNLLHVEEFCGYPIVLSRQTGFFVANTGEGTTVRAPTLGEVHEKIKSLIVSKQQYERANQEPARVVAYTPATQTVEELLITGIVPNRRDPKVIKTKQGQRDVPRHGLCILHPDDSRIHSLRGAVKNMVTAEAALTLAGETLRNVLATLPVVSVPRVETREDAMRQEPAFLAALRAVRPE